MPVLVLIITDVGRAEIVNADNTGTLPVVINQVALGSGKWSPDATATALQTEIKRVNTIGGVAINPDTIHVTITDESSDVYSLGEFGLYTDTGVLFAIYSDAVDGITDKVADIALLMANDVVFTSIAPGSITVGGTGFLNPTASETQAGVLPIATQLLVDLGLDHTSAVTPKTLASILSMYLLSVSYNAADVLNKLLTVDGATSNLDADLLDGQHGAFYRNSGNQNAGTLPGARFLDSSHGNRGGGSLHALAGSVDAGFMSPFNFNKLDGVEPAATADQTAAEIKIAYESNASTNALTDALLTKLNGIEAGARADQTAAEIKTAYESNASTNALTDTLLAKLNGIEAGARADQTAAEILALLLTVDGLNSSLDADLLRGAAPSEASTSNSIAKRNASGHLYASYFNTTANFTTALATALMIETGSDGFVRRQTAAQFIANHNIATQAYADASDTVLSDAIDNLIKTYKSAEQTITAASALTLAHSLSVTPTLIRAVLICKTAEGGYAVGDVVEVSQTMNDVNTGISITSDAINVYIRYGASGATFIIINKTTGANFGILNSRWKLVITAIKL